MKEEAAAITEMKEELKEELKEFQAEVADVPKVLDATLSGEAKTCDLFGMCGP